MIPSSHHITSPKSFYSRRFLLSLITSPLLPSLPSICAPEPRITTPPQSSSSITTQSANSTNPTQANCSPGAVCKPSGELSRPLKRTSNIRTDPLSPEILYLTLGPSALAPLTHLNLARQTSPAVLPALPCLQLNSKKRSRRTAQSGRRYLTCGREGEQSEQSSGQAMWGGGERSGCLAKVTSRARGEMLGTTPMEAAGTIR